MKTLTIKQPWASLIVTPSSEDSTKGIKDIENRTWPTKFRGTVLIHAGASTTFNAFMPDGSTVNDKLEELGLNWFYYDIPHSAIIGSVDIVDCVVNHPSVWAEKNNPADLPEGITFIKPVYNWVLENAVLFENPILNVKGKLSLWDYQFSEEDMKKAILKASM